MENYTPTYPPVAIQHSRCVMAVSVANAVMQFFKEPADKALIGQLQKIRRWLDDCEAQIKSRQLSRGAMRDIDRKLSQLDAAFNVKDLDDEALFQRACALVWTADTFILDVRCTCPEYRRVRCWRYLWQTWGTLAEWLLAICPGADEQGCALYERAA
ncbi:MAG: hypothetical protein IJD16_01380 [Desulfovibrio sp.]|nr:hypothetical protein [Desulfovibrio sp.]